MDESGFLLTHDNRLTSEDLLRWVQVEDGSIKKPMCLTTWFPPMVPSSSVVTQLLSRVVMVELCAEFT